MDNDFEMEGIALKVQQRTNMRVVALATVLLCPPQLLNPGKTVPHKMRNALPSRQVELIEVGMTFLQMNRNPKAMALSLIHI